MADRPDPAVYGSDYFENGTVLGISGYSNYRWLPELTIRMVFYLIRGLGINQHDRILDFGCAKGYVVKAFRILDHEAYGVDVSEYAIQQVDSDVRDYCWRISGVEDASLYGRAYHWLLAKDTLEHMTVEEIRLLMARARANVEKMFVVVPLAKDDVTGSFVIEEYERDVTHITAKTANWWETVFREEGWRVKESRYSFPGCKENWTSRWSDGNGFFVLSS